MDDNQTVLQNDVRSCCYDTSPINGKHGLYVVDDVITEDEEEKLLQLVTDEVKIKLSSDNESSKNGDVKSRVCIHYGYTFDPTTLKVSTKDPLEIRSIPNIIIDTLKVVFEKSHLDVLRNWDYDQITINRYLSEKKSGIAAHVDTHTVFDDKIVVLSLGAPTVMRFDLPDPVSTPKASNIYYEPDPAFPKRVDMWIKPRSLLVMTGPSRYLYKHRIQVRKTDINPEGKIVDRSTRTSVTVRKVRTDGVCRCEYPIMCDYQNPVSLHVPDRLGKQ